MHTRKSSALFVVLLILATLFLERQSFAAAPPRSSTGYSQARAGSGRVAQAHPAVTCSTGKVWTGKADDNQWTTANNWSTGGVPVSTDNVCIASSFSTAITITSLAATNQSISSLTSGAPLAFTNGPLTISGAASFGADFNISSGTLTLNGASSMTTLEMSNGTMSGTGTLTVSGLLTWSGGTLSGTGTTNANGGMAISGEPFLDTRTLNNAATAVWNGTAFLMLDGAVFNNKSGATWNHQGDSQIANEGGATPTFNNAGTFEKTSGTTASGGGVGSSIIFNNTSVVQSNSGTLFIEDVGSCGSTCAGSWSVSSGTILQLGTSASAALNGPVSGAGSVAFATTGTINYTGTYNITGGTAANGAIANFVAPASPTNVGPLTITQGTLNFSTGKAISVTTLTQSGGTLTGTDTITVSKAVTWSGGTESGTGITNANGGMAISGEPFLDTRTLNNTATAVWNGSAFLMLDGAVFNNKAGATWNHQGDSQIANEGGATPTFNNAGTFEKTAGTTASGGGVGSSIIFNNTSVVQSNSGTLFIEDVGSCGSTCAGSWSVSSGTILQLGTSASAALNGPVSGAGSVLFAPSGTINYTGTYKITGGTDVSGATANFVSPGTATDVGPVTITQGTLNFSTGKAVSMTTLAQSGGTLTGNDAITVADELTWSGGTESGTGITNANGGMAISGEPILDTRILNNAKIAVWNGSSFLMLDGAVFNNKSGATWNHEGDTQITNEGGATPTFNNAGTFEKTSGTTASGGGVGTAVTFNNSGTIAAKKGILLLGNSFTQTKGSTLLEGGSISMTGSSTLAEQAGSVLGSGTITGNLTNTAGVVSPSLLSPKVTTGALTLTGSDVGNFVQNSGGTLLFNIAGTNAGNFDTLAVSGSATLGGTAALCLINGFKPTIGTTFPVMSYASASGSFSKVEFGWSLSVGGTSAVAKYNGAPTDLFSVAALAFPSQLLNKTSSALTETLTNSGQATLTINSISLAGADSADFLITSNTCGSTLTTGASCALTVTFTPSVLGKRSATITIVDNACGSPHVIPLTGSGTEITMSPTPVNFGSETVGKQSGPMTVTLTNHGTTAVTVTKVAIAGTDKSDFAVQSNGCTSIAANGGTCTINVTFKPVATGARTGSLSITDSDKGSPQTDSLEGTGS